MANMPAGSGEDAQRFATAVELGRSPGPDGGEDLARELEIVRMLRSRSRAYDPSPAAKALAKQRLAALLTADAPESGHRTGTLLEPAFPTALTQANAVSETVPTDLTKIGTRGIPAPARELVRPATAAALSAVAAPQVAATPIGAGHGTSAPLGSAIEIRRPGGRHSLPSRPGGRSGGSRRPMSTHRRFSLIGSAALVMTIALAGVGMLSSRDALPGDKLYTVKQVAESAGLALTFDDEIKARRHLQLASTRLDEVEQLMKADPKVAADDPQLVTSAIQNFDDSTGQAARILLRNDAADGGGDAREDLRTWAAAQWGRLSQLKPALPASTGADSALHLLDRVVVRSEALQVQPACTTSAPGSVDDLGPVPGCLPDGSVNGVVPDPTLGVDSGTDSRSQPGAPDDQTSAGPSSTRDTTKGGAGPTPRPGTGSGGSSGPNTSRKSSAKPAEPRSDDPPTDGTAVEGSPSGSEPSSSPARPSPSESHTNNAGDDGGLPIPPLDLPPLPDIPGVSF